MLQEGSCQHHGLGLPSLCNYEPNKPLFIIICPILSIVLDAVTIFNVTIHREIFLQRHFDQEWIVQA